MLIHIIEQNAPKEVHGERHLTSDDEACAYLKETADRVFPPSVPVERHVHTTEVSNISQSIVDHVGETGSDLIIMCTHGRGGLHSLLFGSIAQQVIALGSCPVLLIQPPDGDFPPFTCQQIIVPLDGNPDHEAGLTVAGDMARACSAAVHLMMVIHKTSTLTGEQAAAARMLPHASAALLNMTHEHADEYLNGQAGPLQAEGIAVTAGAYRGEPATVIAQIADDMKADLIVLGTHGKAGLDAFWSGSITPKIARQTRTPLLLIRVHAAEE